MEMKEALWAAEDQTARLSEMMSDDPRLKEAPLRRDVRSLGRLLGDVLKEQAGQALFDRVEQLRRSGDQRFALTLSRQQFWFLIDVIRADISRYGITRIRRVAALAETYYVGVAPFHDGGPIATAAALNLAASLPNFFIQQLPLPADPQDFFSSAEIRALGWV